MNNFRKKIETLIFPGFMLAMLLPLLHLVVRKSFSKDEYADIAVFVIFLFFVSGALLNSIWPRFVLNVGIGGESKFWISFQLLVALIYSASIVTVLPGVEGVYWFGFGNSVAGLAVLLLPFVRFIHNNENQKLHILLSVAVYGIIIVFYLPSIFQPPWGVIDIGHSMYVLNEVMAQGSGSFPMVNFVAQYTSLLGYVFNILLMGKGGIDEAVWFLTVLAIGVVVLMFYPLAKEYPKGKRYLALLFTIPAIFIVKANEDHYSGSLAILFSAIPIRLLFPAIVVFLITQISNDKVNAKLKWALLGVVCVFSILNNVESGIVTVVATIIVQYVVNREGFKLNSSSFLMAFVTTGLFYTLIIFEKFNVLNVSWLVAFAGGFGKGAGSVGMPSYGLWVFVFIYLFFCVGFSVYNSEYVLILNKEKNILIVTLFWSLFGVGMLPYYINRSVVSGQLQFILLPVFISCAGLFHMVSNCFRWQKISRFILVISSLPPAISIASLQQSPSVALASSRIVNVEKNISQNQNQTIADVLNAASSVSINNRSSNVGLFINYGSTLSARTGLKSYLPVNNYSDLSIINLSLGKSTCSYLYSDKIDYLVVAKDIPDNATALLKNCGFFPENSLSDAAKGMIYYRSIL